MNRFLSAYWTEYDRGDSFPSDFEPNGIPFGSKLQRKRSPRAYSVRFERKRKSNLASAGGEVKIKRGVKQGQGDAKADVSLRIKRVTFRIFLKFKCHHSNMEQYIP